MRPLFAVVLVLLAPVLGTAQQGKVPVVVSHTGNDQVGSAFVTAFNRELSHSAGYEPGRESIQGPRFYVEFITVDPSENASDRGKKSVVSVVIQQMGLPNSYPVADMWYHKVIIVKRQAVEKTAKGLLQDIDARWCKQLRNASGGCPTEKFEPRL